MKNLTKNRKCLNCGETEERIKGYGLFCFTMSEANESCDSEVCQEFDRHRYDKPKYK